MRALLGSPFLSHGFRPFFFLAAAWGALALPLFLASFTGLWLPPLALDPIAWHSHEMLFGFAGAALAGFLLTAMPNWTGRLPLKGGPLLVLVGLWFLARLATTTLSDIGAIFVVPAVLSFPAVLLFVFLREIVVGKAWRRLPLLAGLTVFLLADAALLAETYDIVALDGLGARLGVAVFAALITLMGGRLVPSFTINWLKARGETSLPPGFGAFDRVALLTGVVSLIAWVLVPGEGLVAALLALAALFNAVRLVRWRGWRTGAEPLLWVLHLGYLWLVVGYAMLAASIAGEAVSQAAALHTLGTGAIGTMILAVMSRATLGHTGRALHAGPGLTCAYLLMSAAAVMRIASAMIGDSSIGLLWGAAAAWVGALLIFLVICGPMMVRPRMAKGAAT